MKFLITRVTTSKLDELKDITTIEELVDIIRKEKHAIIIDTPYKFKSDPPVDYDYEVKIYDDYLE